MGLEMWIGILDFKGLFWRISFKISSLPVSSFLENPLIFCFSSVYLIPDINTTPSLALYSSSKFPNFLPVFTDGDRV